MGKTRLPYTPEFRRQMVELVQAGRLPEELAREFEPWEPPLDASFCSLFDRCNATGKCVLDVRDRGKLTRRSNTWKPEPVPS